MAARGCVNGFLLPPIFVEHMDDPWSQYYSGNPSPIRKLNGCATDEQVWEFHLAIIREILDGPWDVKSYLGWRGKLRGKTNRLKRKLAKLGFGERPQDFRALRAARTAAAT